MTFFPKCLTEFPNMHTAFPFHLSINKLNSGFIAHRHDYLEFSFVISGRGSETINGITHRMEPGTFTFVLPYQIHEIHTAGTAPLQLYNCSFGMDLLFDSFLEPAFGSFLTAGEERLPAYAQVTGEQYGKMLGLFQEMQQEYSEAQVWKNALLKAKLVEALVMFDRIRRETVNKPKGSVGMALANEKTAADIPGKTGKPAETEQNAAAGVFAIAGAGNAGPIAAGGPDATRPIAMGLKATGSSTTNPEAFPDVNTGATDSAAPAELPGTGRTSGKRGNSDIWQVIHYVHRHYQEPLALSALAEQFHFSISHLSELFKKTVGQTFVQFLHEVRIRHACGLLSSTEVNVSDVALEAGFGSYKTFVRTFREYKGITPAQYRKKK